MPGPSTLALFALASYALIAVPGPSVLFIVTRSLEHGRGAGLVSMLGVQAGALVHVAAAALGVSALLASSATAFTAVKLAGAAYLVLLGVQRLRRGSNHAPAAPPAVPRRRLFRQGMLVNALNPKTAIFFLAFLPQFVDPAGGAPVALQVLVLGLLFVAIAFLSDGAYALAAGTLGNRLRRSPRIRARLERASGVVFVGLGAVAALARRGGA